VKGTATLPLALAASFPSTGTPPARSATSGAEPWKVPRAAMAPAKPIVPVALPE
jgi:hypothetical protein